MPLFCFTWAVRENRIKSTEYFFSLPSCYNRRCDLDTKLNPAEKWPCLCIMQMWLFYRKNLFTLPLRHVIIISQALLHGRLHLILLGISFLLIVLLVLVLGWLRWRAKIGENRRKGIVRSLLKSLREAHTPLFLQLGNWI